MATVADASVDKPYAPQPGETGVAAFIDRWIWVFTAGLLMATVLAGFVPDSIAMVGLVTAGKRPPFPAVLHVHAILMAAWLALLLAQTTLMATGNRRWHMQLGLAGMVLAPAMVVTGLILVPTIYGAGWMAMHAANPALPSGAVPPALTAATDIALFQVRTGILFPLVVALGLSARRNDPGMHKRLMILATVLPISAATARITWLPSTVPASPLTLELYPVLLVSPMFLWDLYRLRRVHRAYLVWIALVLPFAVAARLLWNSPWWFATWPHLLGLT